jgi:hypothetical protein
VRILLEIISLIHQSHHSPRICHLFCCLSLLMHPMIWSQLIS